MLLYQRLLFFTFIYSSFVTSSEFFFIFIIYKKKEPYPFSNRYVYNLPTFPCLFCSFYAEWLPYSVLFLSYASCTIESSALLLNKLPSCETGSSEGHPFVRRAFSLFSRQIFSISTFDYHYHMVSMNIWAS